MTSVSGNLPGRLRWLGVSVFCVVGLVTCGVLWPRLNSMSGAASGAKQGSEAEPSGHSHSADTHGEHGTEDSLELSGAALRNLGLTDEFLKPLEVGAYRRALTIPAVVVPRPGRTQMEVSAPLTGVVTHVHAVTGEAVTPGTLLFEVRLTHEELVTAQTEFLKSLGELDVETREIARLESAAESGAISGRTLLERRYSRDRLEALLRAQREALKLHGLSDRQVAEIETEKRLLRSLQIVAPSVDVHSEFDELRFIGATVRAASQSALSEDEPAEPALVIEHLSVKKGQTVTAGETLCIVADFSDLYIEGQAFDQDAPAIGNTAAKNWPVTAVFPGIPEDTTLMGLKLSFVGSEVDRESRALAFYVDLKNSVTGDTRNAAGQRFVSWKYRPGQRLQLLVPVEEWPAEIVVPVEAVIREGAEWFVFRRNGKNFDRLAVHVKHRDQANAVIANDGTVFPGDVIALRSAHQLQMALKNKSGSGADPHAGHTH